jgi:heterodisulfide reductase subunit B2
MNISYYPGCTLKTNAKHFEDSAELALKSLGVCLDELKRWNCCGTVFSFATDNVMYHLAPVRNLLRAREEGSETLLTLCSMCFNSLKRANLLFNENPEQRDKIKNIMYREDLEYDGKTRVVHLLELLRDEIGLDKLKKNDGLKGVKLAPYYGCMLLRPDGVGIDDPENPSIFEDVISAMGAEPVYFPFNSECCGAFQTVANPDIVADRTFAIIESARNSGADAVVVSCPLCAFNLDQRQKLTAEKYSTFEMMPVFYITELLCIAIEIEYCEDWKNKHYVPVDSFLDSIRTRIMAGHK